MLIIGLTGGSGSGKSTAAKGFVQAGYTHIDADFCSRQVMTENSPCVNELLNTFGNLLTKDGELDRRALGSIVFNDKKKLATLNQITHKYIMEHILRMIEDYRKAGVERIVLDAPTLYESGADRICSAVVCVVAPILDRAALIAERDSLPKELAEHMINVHDDSFYLSRADYILRNDGDVEELLRKSFLLGKELQNSKGC